MISTGKDIDVVLLNPGNTHAVYQELSNEFSAIEPPSLAALFASFLRNNDLHVAIVDAPALNLSPAGAARFIYENYRPVLVVAVVYGFQPSASTQNMPAAGETCRALKEIDPAIKILMTGTHPAALPERTLREEAVDFVCDREGPETILETVKALKSDRNNFRDVPSLWYRISNTIFSNPPGELMTHLDDAMPRAAWVPGFDLADAAIGQAHTRNTNRKNALVLKEIQVPVALGHGVVSRMRPPDAGHGKAAAGDKIDVDRQRLLYNVKLDPVDVPGGGNAQGGFEQFSRHVPVTRVSTSRASYSRMGFSHRRSCSHGWMHNPAASSHGPAYHPIQGVKGALRRSAKTPQPALDPSPRATPAAQRYPLEIQKRHIFGLPDDTPESMQETLDLAIECNCEFANFYCAMAYPGSKLYAMAIQNGWELPSSWIGYSQHSYETHPLRTETLTSADVLRFRDEAFIKYFTAHSYLNMLRERFGEEVVSHIAGMTKIRLKRRLLGD